MSVKDLDKLCTEKIMIGVKGNKRIKNQSVKAVLERKYHGISVKFLWLNKNIWMTNYSYQNLSFISRLRFIIFERLSKEFWDKDNPYNLMLVGKITVGANENEFGWRKWKIGNIIW